MPAGRRAIESALGLLVACYVAGALAACVSSSEATPTIVEIVAPPTTSPTAQPSATSLPLTRPHLSPTPAPAGIMGAVGPQVTSTPGVVRVLLEPGVCPAPAGPAVLQAGWPVLIEIAHRYEPVLVDYLNGGGTVEGIPGQLAAFPTPDFGDLRPGDPLMYLRSIDLAGGSDQEIVVGLGWAHFGAVYVLGRDGETYKALVALPFAVGERQHTRSDSGIRALLDLNGNGRLEILFSYVDEVEIVDPTRTSYEYFSRQVVQLLEWNGTSFDYLSFSADGSAPFACRAEVARGDIELVDRDEDGALELVLVSDVIFHPRSGPQRVRRETWDWREDHLQFTFLDIGPPVFRFQAVQDADDLVRLGEYDPALTLYQDAIFDPDLLPWSRDRWWPDGYYQGMIHPGGNETPGPIPTPDPDERPRLEAYARYRLIVLHAARGDPYSARIAYDELRERALAGPGLVYAELAAAFWEPYSSDQQISAGCGAAVEFARANAAEILAPLGAGYYGWANRNYEPMDICPFGGPA